MCLLGALVFILVYGRVKKPAEPVIQKGEHSCKSPQILKEYLILWKLKVPVILIFSNKNIEKIVYQECILKEHLVRSSDLKGC